MKSCNKHNCNNCEHFTCYQIRFGAIYYCELSWDDDKEEFTEDYICKFKEKEKRNETD